MAYANMEYKLCGSLSSLAVGELVVGAGVVDVVSKDMSKQLQIAEVWNQISFKHRIFMLITLICNKLVWDLNYWDTQIQMMFNLLENSF